MVVDASVLANVVGDDGADGRRARGEIRSADDVAAPDLVDVETVAVLRKRWLAGTISDRRFATAVADLGAIDLDRYPTLPLMRRAYQLRANVTAYDAAYIALAEILGCELLTGDTAARQRARAPMRCPRLVVTHSAGRWTQTPRPGIRARRSVRRCRRFETAERSRICAAGNPVAISVRPWGQARSSRSRRTWPARGRSCHRANRPCATSRCVQRRHPFLAREPARRSAVDDRREGNAGDEGGAEGQHAGSTGHGSLLGSSKALRMNHRVMALPSLDPPKGQCTSGWMER